MSPAEIQSAPKKSLILLAGPPGSGKSTFCHQAVLNALAMDRPVIFVTTERAPSEVIALLEERGMGEPPPGALSFVDAFGETVGAATPERPDTVGANCEDLNSISMAIAKLQERIGGHDTLLAFDSLTSPYLFNKEGVFRFMRLCLAKFASEGNSVLALMDEGCGKEEDLGAMMSVADGIIRMEIKKSSRTVNVVKHPRVEPTRIEVPMKAKPTIRSAFDAFKSAALSHPSRFRQWLRSMWGQAVMRSEVGDFVNLFWPQFVRWSSILWDPKGFPTMMYELYIEDGDLSMRGDMYQFYPWRARLLLKIMGLYRALGLFPKKVGNVKDMKDIARVIGGQLAQRTGTVEYLEDISKPDEHYFRIYESSDCWGFENIGVPIAFHVPTHMAGMLRGLEKDGRDWNTVETKCIGLGDPYCEFKLVPGEIVELRSSLEKDASLVERIHERLMERLMGFLLHGKPLVERPRLGSDVHLHPVIHAFGFPYLAVGGERYRMALRMGGARSGKEVGERLMEAGLGEEEAIERVIDFMNYCKVGTVTMDETIRIRENCESFSSWLFAATQEPSCFFTTGFLNGLFSAVKNQHVREIKCVVAGDPYCEWEFL